MEFFEAPSDLSQPFVEIFPFELYFGAALRTRERRALAQIAERRFKLSGAAFIGAGDIHCVRVEKLHVLTLRCNERPFLPRIKLLADHTLSPPLYDRWDWRPHLPFFLAAALSPARPAAACDV